MEEVDKVKGLMDGIKDTVAAKAIKVAKKADTFLETMVREVHQIKGLVERVAHDEQFLNVVNFNQFKLVRRAGLCMCMYLLCRIDIVLFWH